MHSSLPYLNTKCNTEISKEALSNKIKELILKKLTLTNLSIFPSSSKYGQEPVSVLNYVICAACTQLHAGVA